MIRFGVIGTNFITDRFLKAGEFCEDFQLTAVYSRTIDRAKEYAAQHSDDEPWKACTMRKASRF